MEQVTLSGVNETLLVPLYARALESRKENALFRDETAMQIVGSLDYDFTKIAKSKMNMWGCAARTLLFDEQTKKHLELHPDCSVINLACGLDDRFRRVDNGRIQWYNIDLPAVMELRKKLIPQNDRVTELACSAFDRDWMDQVEDRDHALILAEGFLMYVTEQQVKDLLEGISRHFRNSLLLLELMSRWMADHQNLHSIHKTNQVTFRWGVESGKELCDLCPAYQLIEEQNFTETMRQFAPVRLGLLAPVLRRMNNLLCVYSQVPG